MGGFGVKIQHFPLTLLVVLTTLTLPCERDVRGGSLESGSETHVCNAISSPNLHI